MVDAFEEIENDALEGRHLHTCSHHRLNSNVAVLNLHRSASIDDHKDVKITSEQVQCRLLHTDMSFAAVQDDRVFLERSEVCIDFRRQHGELLLAFKDLNSRKVLG